MKRREEAGGDDVLLEIHVKSERSKGDEVVYKICSGAGGYKSVNEIFIQSTSQNSLF